MHPARPPRIAQCLLAALAWGWLGLAPATASAPGAVVEDLGKDFGPARVALRPGDVIVGWTRGTRRGEIRASFDARPMAIEELACGDVGLRVIRDGQAVTVEVPHAAWPFEIEVRPRFGPDVLALYDQGRALVGEKNVAEGVQRWREAAAARAGGGEDPASLCWLYGRIGRAWGEVARREELEAAYDEAFQCAKSLEPTVAAQLRIDKGRIARDRGWFDIADAAHGELVAATGEQAPPLIRAAALQEHARTLTRQGRDKDAFELLKQVLAVHEAEVPESLVVARTLLDIAAATSTRNKEEAERLLARADEICTAKAPGTSLHTQVLQVAGGLASMQGDYARTERTWRRGLAMAPEGAAEYAALLGSLGSIAYVRGDIDLSQTLTRRARELSQAAGDRENVAVLLGNLGNLARVRGDLGLAETLLRQAAEERKTVSVEPIVPVAQLITLGRVLRAQGDRAGAKACFEQALAESEKSVPIGQMGPLLELGEIARLERDWDAAEHYYRRGLPWLTRWHGVGSAPARLLHGLGAVGRARGRPSEAAAFFTQAVDALESVRGRSGGTDEARSFFISGHYGIYHDHAELLVAMGRLEEAYGVLELARARSLLALLAERDLLLDDEIPADLERRRRRVDAEYQDTHRKVLGLDEVRDAEAKARLAETLRGLRSEQQEIGLRIRDASPRLADARYPEPLPTSEIQASLEPGTVLLVYSVGERSTLLFGVTPDGLTATTIGVGEDELRRRIDGWSREIAKGVPRPAFYKEARGLYDALLGPIDGRLREARRVVISPSGPLHGLPFAALMRQGRYLAEWKPTAIVPSGTLLAQSARSRREQARSCMLVGFGDPVRPAAGKSRLPESRRELEAVAGACSERALHVGEGATEARAKRLPRQARYVHFACHALVNAQLPLDSGLALHVDEGEAKASADDGLLQAWEIYEHVRVDADLVTLSACDSGSGKALGGEGLLGLTRAFQYAGARSVAASLWAAPDRSTVELMRTFYAGLKRGLAKDEALRQAQVAAIRRGGVASRPFRWAGFQLYGDWK